MVAELFTLHQTKVEVKVKVIRNYHQKEKLEMKRNMNTIFD